MIAAKAGKLGQRVKWDIVGEMFFNIGGNDPLLPGCERGAVLLGDPDAALPAPRAERFQIWATLLWLIFAQPSPV